MGIPVVSQKTKALQEYFTTDAIAFCEPIPEKIGDRIIDLMSDRPKAKEIGQKGLDIYNKKFSKDAYLNQVLSVFQATDDSRKFR